MKIPLLLFLGGLVAGGVFAWRPQGPMVPEQTPAPNRVPATDRVTVDRVRAEIYNARPDQPSIPTVTDPGPYPNLLDDWSTEEIRAALADTVSRPDSALELYGLRLAVQVLIQTWLQRDAEAVVSWFDTIKIPAMQRQLASHILTGWPFEQAEKGLDFFLSHRDLYTTSPTWSIVEKNVISSAAAGPNKLAALLSRLHDEDVSFDFQLRTPFPQGFDFANFVETEAYRSQGDEPMLSSVMSEWLAADSIGAAAFLMERGGVKNIVQATGGISFIRDQDKRERLWTGLADFVGSLPAEQQSDFMDEASLRLKSVPDAAATFAEHVGDRALADRAHELAAHVIQRGEVEAALSHLEAIGDPARRITFLENLEVSPGRSIAPTTTQLELLRSKLNSWGATPEQSDEILGHIKP